MQSIEGVGTTPLAGVGTAVWYETDDGLDDPPDPSTVDPATEHERFASAREQATTELERERERTAETVGEGEAAVFDAHAQFVDDPQLADGVEDAIENGRPAEHAVYEVLGEHVERFESMDGRMAERADDLRDVRDRLVRILTDGERVDLGSLPENAVLLAERLTPSDTAALDPERVAGFATATGGRTSHAAIFAQSLAIPAVVGVGDDLDEIEDGATVAVDGDRGLVTPNPDEETRARAAETGTEDVIERSVETADGRAIEVAANLGTPAEIEGAVARGADGVGLLRTEFLFMDREAPPSEDEQRETYESVLSAFPDDQVVVRTLDIGGDKPVPYLDAPAEENPFLGERGVRRSLGSDADLFETQLRALLRAAGSEHGDGLAVMFPLVSTVEELDRALAAVDRVAETLDDEGVAYAVPDLGVMIETPASVFGADEFAERVDFLSIGTNDLTQYVMAAARENDRVADLHDPTYPAVLRAIRRTVKAGHANDCWVGMCGEMAGDPEYTELLVGLGLDELSMSAVTVPAVKAGVEATDSEDANDLAVRALAASTKDQVNETITQTQ